MARNLPFVQDAEKPDKSRKGSKKPDLTIGLCTYDLDAFPWHEGHRLANDDRVKLFDRRFLNGIQNHFNIRPLYHLKDNQAKDDSPQFPFMLWEAKSAVYYDTHQTALHQTAPSLTKILIWQQDFYKKSEVCRSPLVWHFNNVGSDCKLYACFAQSSSRTGVSVYVSPCYTSCLT